jgi:hypothetical protein
VIQSECRKTGSLMLSLKLSRPTHGWSFETEKSNSTKLTQRENPSGKIDRARMSRTAGATKSHRTCRSIQEETTLAGRLLGTVSTAPVATLVGVLRG